MEAPVAVPIEGVPNPAITNSLPEKHKNESQTPTLVDQDGVSRNKSAVSPSDHVKKDSDQAEEVDEIVYPKGIQFALILVGVLCLSHYNFFILVWLNIWLSCRLYRSVSYKSKKRLVFSRAEILQTRFNNRRASYVGSSNLVHTSVLIYPYSPRISNDFHDLSSVGTHSPKFSRWP